MRVAVVDEGRANAAAEQQLGWLLETVGLSALDGLGWIRVTGEDRVRWLNGMVTNSITELKPGEGNYSFALNAQGRIQGDLTAFAEAEALWLETARDRVPAMMALLDHYIIMDDVELSDVSLGRVGIGVAGPRAKNVLELAGLGAPEGLRRVKAVWDGVGVEVIGAYGPLVPRYEIWADELTCDRLRVTLLAAAETQGGGLVGAEAVEWLRMLEGTPKFGVDIRDKELPQETGQTRALHFAKGCYLGQEIVERIRSRGNVHRGFGGFRLEGALPAAGTALEVEAKAVGELTSVAVIPLTGGSVQLGLGYVRREVVERGAEIVYRAEAGVGRAVPVPLPWREDSASAESSSIRQD
jgi:folate-binding protein YgfZ